MNILYVGSPLRLLEGSSSLTHSIAPLSNLTISPSKMEEMSNNVIDAIGGEELQHSMIVLAMLLGKLLSHNTLNPEQEVEFVQQLLDWGGSYVAVIGEVKN